MDRRSHINVANIDLYSIYKYSTCMCRKGMELVSESSFWFVKPTLKMKLRKEIHDTRFGVHIFG